MRRGNIAAIAVIFAMIPIMACQKVQKPALGTGMKLTIIFYPRDCNVVGIDLFQGHYVAELTDSVFPAQGLMAINVAEVQRWFCSSNRWHSAWAYQDGHLSTNPNLNMENQIRSILNGEYESRMIQVYRRHPEYYQSHDIVGGPGDIPVWYEYRTEELEAFSVTASRDMFGRKAGEPLEDLMLFQLPTYENFVFSPDGKLAARKEQNFPIKEYLALSPMCFATIFGYFAESPPEAPLEDVQFTVEVKIKGKEPMRATTRPVTVVP